MTNKMLARYIESFKATRSVWLDILVENPDSTAAAQHIVSINSKIELMRSLWNWSDESVPYC